MMSWRGRVPQPDHQENKVTSQPLGCLIYPDLYRTMAPPTASAKLTLTYPLYAADFDPENNGFLLVGGGGGEGRSGVGNQIVSSPRHCKTLLTIQSIDTHRHVSKASANRAGRHSTLAR